MKGKFQPMRERLLTIALALSSCVCVASCTVRSAHDNREIRTSNLPSAQPGSLSNRRLRHEASPLFLLNEQMGWVVSNGTLYRTKDGGAHWQRMYSTDPSYSVEVFFATEQEGWMTINQWSGRLAHLVLRTKDGGRSWQQLLNLESPIYTIQFINERMGFARNRWELIRRTSDGGETWKELNLLDEPGRSSLFEGLQYFFFISEKEGWGYGSSIWHTTDGADTWTEVVADEKIDGILSSAAFVDNKHGWIVGSGRQIWRMTDGSAWQRVTNIPSAEGPAGEASKQLPNLNSITFVNTNNGWIAADDKTILHSSDGGENWQIISRLTSSIKALRFLNETEGWAIDDKGRLLRSIDAGRTWNVRALR